MGQKNTGGLCRNRREFFKITGTIMGGILTSEMLPVQGTASTGRRKPNIVVILADDLGYGDLGCQGCPDVPTPYTDSIAKNGVRFTDGYANHPFCAPSRAGLLSGRYQQRFGFEFNPGRNHNTEDYFGLPCTERTLAGDLKELGYVTGIVGKWHLGFQEKFRPNNRGFDFFYGFIHGKHNYLPEGDLLFEEDPIQENGKPVQESAYLTDALGREAVEFINRSKDKPFFLYLSFNAVHSELEATEHYMERFAHITGTDRRTYAGMLSAMDDAVGRVLDTLRTHQLEEDTLLFFYSDNGAPTPKTTSRNDPLRGYKGDMLEGGIRIPFLVQWKGHIPAGKVYQQPIMAFDIYATALSVAGGAMPQDKPLDGVNLIPYLTGENTGVPHKQLFWREGPRWAARVGDWKLVNPEGEAIELYNLKADIGETQNLAEKEPKKFEKIKAVFDEWSRQMIPAKWDRKGLRTKEAASESESAE